MEKERTRFKVSDTYKEIQWTTPIGCVEFIIRMERWGFKYHFHYLHQRLFAIINDDVNYRLSVIDSVKGRERLVKKINAMIKSKIYGSPLMSQWNTGETRVKYYSCLGKGYMPKGIKKMEKEELVKKLINEVEKVDCAIIRVYGVVCGVGYDLNIVITFKNGYQKTIEAHAGPKSWCSPGHLRDRQYSFYNYTGKNDCYRQKVIDYWTSKNGFISYLHYFKKPELEKMIEKINS